MNRVASPITLTPDQVNTMGSSLIGLGEYNIIRYRGETFTPTLTEIGYLNFSLVETKTADMAVFLTDVDQSTNLPTGSVLAQWIIPNSSLAVGGKDYTLLPAYKSLTPGHKYGFYLAPYVNGVYSDNYRDFTFSNTNAFAGGVSFGYDASSTGWFTDTTLDFVFTEGKVTSSLRTVAGTRTAATTRTTI